MLIVEPLHHRMNQSNYKSQKKVHKFGSKMKMERFNFFSQLYGCLSLKVFNFDRLGIGGFSKRGWDDLLLINWKWRCQTFNGKNGDKNLGPGRWECLVQNTFVHLNIVILIECLANFSDDGKQTGSIVFLREFTFHILIQFKRNAKSFWIWRFGTLSSNKSKKLFRRKTFLFTLKLSIKQKGDFVEILKN